MASTLSCLLATCLFALAAAQHQGANGVPLDHDLTGGRHSDLAARVSFGTAISLILPVALGVALVALLMPLFAAPFGPVMGAYPSTLGYARKGKSMFSGLSQENVMHVLDSVSKAIDAFSAKDEPAKSKTK